MGSNHMHLIFRDYIKRQEEAKNKEKEAEKKETKSKNNDKEK